MKSNTSNLLIPGLLCVEAACPICDFAVQEYLKWDQYHMGSFTFLRHAPDGQ